MQMRELGLPFWKAVSNSQPGLLGRQTYPEGGEGHFLFSSLSPFSVSLLHSHTFPDAHQQDPKWVLEPWAPRETTRLFQGNAIPTMVSPRLLSARGQGS